MICNGYVQNYGVWNPITSVKINFKLFKYWLNSLTVAINIDYILTAVSIHNISWLFVNVFQVLMSSIKCIVLLKFLAMWIKKYIVFKIWYDSENDLSWCTSRAALVSNWCLFPDFNAWIVHILSSKLLWDQTAKHVEAFTVFNTWMKVVACIHFTLTLARTDYCIGFQNQNFMTKFSCIFEAFQTDARLKRRNIPTEIHSQLVMKVVILGLPRCRTALYDTGRNYGQFWEIWGSAFDHSYVWPSF